MRRPALNMLCNGEESDQVQTPLVRNPQGRQAKPEGLILTATSMYVLECVLRVGICSKNRNPPWTRKTTAVVPPYGLFTQTIKGIPTF